MQNQNNNQNQKNKNSGGSTNQRRRFYRKSNNSNKPNGNGNNSNGSNQKVQAKREMEFHMHDAQARKTSESYEKIRKAIILKIQESFEDSINVVDSLRKKKKIVVAKPDWKNYVSQEADPANKVEEQKHLDAEREADLKNIRKR